MMKIIYVNISYGDENAEKIPFTDNLGIVQYDIKDYWKNTNKFSVILTSMKNGWTKNRIEIKVVVDAPFEEFNNVTEWVKNSFPKSVKVRVLGTGDWYKSTHPELCDKIELILNIDRMDKSMGSINENGIKRIEKFYQILQKQLNYQE